jgi:hypothetical protein
MHLQKLVKKNVVGAIMFHSLIMGHPFVVATFLGSHFFWSTQNISTTKVEGLEVWFQC